MTDSTASLQAVGSIGVGTYLSGSATNAPVVASFDDLWVGPPHPEQPRRPDTGTSRHDHRTNAGSRKQMDSTDNPARRGSHMMGELPAVALTVA